MPLGLLSSMTTQLQSSTYQVIIVAFNKCYSRGIESNGQSRVFIEMSHQEYRSSFQ